MAILDSAGVKVVEYKYDAWGKPLGVEGTLKIAELNPFRYRGYVWDEETGLYYLRSRYYDAWIGRFVCADTDIDASTSYRYCCNNPLSRADSSGRSSFFIWISEYTKLHNEVALRVAAKVFGVVDRSLTYISGAGRKGGPGFPDVKVLSNRRVWEIKPKTQYGLTTGKQQMERYINGTGYSAGYPVDIDPFEYELFGQKGIVEITNGSEMTEDAGVVYYEFNPNKEKRPDPFPLPERVHQTESSSTKRSWALTALCIIGIIMAYASPVPGDEILLTSMSFTL